MSCEVSSDTFFLKSCDTVDNKKSRKMPGQESLYRRWSQPDLNLLFVLQLLSNTEEGTKFNEKGIVNILDALVADWWGCLQVAVVYVLMRSSEVLSPPWPLQPGASFRR